MLSSLSLLCSSLVPLQPFWGWFPVPSWWLPALLEKAATNCSYLGREEKIQPLLAAMAGRLKLAECLSPQGTSAQAVRKLPF